jgi:hypothetical protein
MFLLHKENLFGKPKRYFGYTYNKEVGDSDTPNFELRYFIATVDGDTLDVDDKFLKENFYILEYKVGGITEKPNENIIHTIRETIIPLRHEIIVSAVQGLASSTVDTEANAKRAIEIADKICSEILNKSNQ